MLFIRKGFILNSTEYEINDVLSSLAVALNCDNREDIARLLKDLDRIGLPQSYASIAMTYEFGSPHVTQRDDLAFEWYVKSATEQNECQSYLSISRFYFHGKYVERDFQQFMKYCEMSYERGCHAAGINLAAHYLNGDDVPIDLGRAERYLQPALADGYIAAFALLGKIEFERKNYFASAKLYLRSIVNTIRLGLRDPQDQRFYSLKNEQSQKNDLALAYEESARRAKIQE